MNETADETTGGKLATIRKPALILIGVLVALIVVGVLAAVFVPRISRRQREATAARAFAEIRTASPARAKELIAAFPELVDARDQAGRAALHLAAWNGHKDVAELFLAKGADVNAKDGGGWTPLHWATWLGHKDVAEVLLANGADVNAKDSKGRTPLALAEERGRTELVELLKKHGAKESE